MGKKKQKKSQNCRHIIVKGFFFGGICHILK
jgi:hypothetical protein